jgi:hypothetical protein
MQLLQTTLGRGRVTFSLLLVFILPMKWGGVFRGWFRCVLILVLVFPKPILPLPPSSLKQFNLFP